MRIMVVDDSASTRALLRGVLTSYGMVLQAADGFEAIELFRMATDSKRPFDLICLDLEMPGKSGHDVLREVRAREHASNVPGCRAVRVVMTTSSTDVTSVARAFKEECDAYVAKPIDKKRLIEALEDCGLCGQSAAPS